MVFSGIGILLSVRIIFDLAELVYHDTDIYKAAKDIDASQYVLIDIFVRIESFFKRLESYTEVPPTAAMTDVIVKIIIEILSIFAIATKEIKQGRSSKYTGLQYIICSWLTSFLEKIVKRLLGRNNIESALRRLDTLTTEEARMAIAETLNVTHKVDDKVTVLVDGGRDTSFWSSTRSWTSISLDVKETNAVVQRSADIAEEEKRS